MSTEANKKKLEDLNVFIVEDEAAIAMLIEDMLLDFDCTVVAHESKLSTAIETAKIIDADVAVLDINLAGDRIYPVAQILRSRGIPFIFSTGYGETGLTEEFHGSPVLQKPFLQDQLRTKLLEIFPEE